MAELDVLQSEIKQLDRNISELKGEFKAHQRHVNNDVNTFKVILDPQQGIMSVIKQMENTIHELDKAVQQIQLNLIVMETKMGFQMMIWGALGGGMVSVIAGAIIYFITKK
jgi:glutamate-1-semialdehyde aminotransferase